MLLLKLERYDEALFYLEKQKTHARKWKQDGAMAAALCNEAGIYLKRKNYPKFDSLAGECLRLLQPYARGSIYFSMVTNIGSSYIERGKPGKALSYFQRVEQMVPKVDPDCRADFYHEYGAALLGAGRYDAAIAKLQQGISLAKEIGIADILKPTEDMAEAYYRSGDYANAARQYRMLQALKDSFRNVAVLNKVNEYEVKFRTMEKDKELLGKRFIILKQQSRLRDKNIQLGIILSIAVLLVIAGIGMYRSSKNARLLQAKALEVVMQQGRIKQLKATIAGEERERERLGRELHDGIGSLLSALNMNIVALQWKNREIPQMKELDNIAGMVQDIAAEVRKSAHNLTPDYLLHDGLLHALLSLAAQVKTSGFSLRVSGYGHLGALQPSFSLMVYRIIQELVNNILKHAQARTADLQIREHDGLLSVVLEDDGVGFEVNRPADGIGLKQIRARVEAVNGHISIDSVQGRGTTVYMEFNLKKLHTG